MNGEAFVLHLERDQSLAVMLGCAVDLARQEVDRGAISVFVTTQAL